MVGERQEDKAEGCLSDSIIILKLSSLCFVTSITWTRCCWCFLFFYPMIKKTYPRTEMHDVQQPISTSNIATFMFNIASALSVLIALLAIIPTVTVD